MRAVLQRVTSGSVTVEGEVIGQIDEGLVILLGVSREDTEKDAEYLVNKIINLRIFEDEAGKMNQSLLDKKGQLLVVSQFTLYGAVKKGRRPSFDKAGEPARAKELYEYFVDLCRRVAIHTETGLFQAHMAVSLVNDGPVTILIDSEKSF